VLWKAYIDMEIKQNQPDRVRALYKRLLERTKHVKVWISRAQFEGSIEKFDAARAIFAEADAYFKQQQNREERVLLLESWREFELRYGDGKTINEVVKKQPRRIKKKRQVKTDDGADAGWEEYYDYIFPDEEDKSGHLKILEMAKKWKQNKADSSSSSTSSASSS